MLADVNQIGLEAAANALSADGHQVVTQQVDVTSRAAVAAAADVAASSGRVTAVVHTAGLSPQQASADASQQRVVPAAHDQPHSGFAPVLVVVDACDGQVGAFGALPDLLNEPPARRVIGIRRVEYDDARLQTLEKYTPAVEHGSEDGDHRIAALVTAQFGSVPLTVVRESACDCGGITAGSGVRVPVHETADLEFVGDGPGQHRGLRRYSGSPSIRRVIFFNCARRVSPSTSASSGCMTATLIALDSIAACRRASTPASVPSRDANACSGKMYAIRVE